MELATAFETALDSAETAATGYIATGLPLIAGVGVAWLGVKYVRRLMNKF